METETALRVEALNAGYGRKTTLQGIDLCVSYGRICAVIGQNGSGKTTLIRCAAGLIAHTGKCVFADGRDTATLRPQERACRIGYLSSAPMIPDGVTCLDTVLAGFSPELGLLGRITQEQRQKALACLGQFGLRELANRPFHTLSGGQRQLALLCRAMVGESRLLLLDEPDAALDYARRRDMMKCLKQYAEGMRCAILIASHDVNAMLRYADDLVLLKDGRIIDHFSCDTDDGERVERALSALYEGIQVIRRGDHWMMTDREEDGDDA